MLDILKDCLIIADAFSLSIFAICFLLFFIFFVLGVYCFKIVFLPLVFFFLSFLFLVSIPFAIAFSSKFFIHQVQVIENHSKPLMYSNSFLLDLQFKNVGRVVLQRCLIVIKPKRKHPSLKNKILDFIKPLDTITYTIKEKIKKNQIYEVQNVLPFAYRDYPYDLSLDCR